MLWGYAGVFPGEFEIWKGDQLTNTLDFMVKHGFKSTHFSLSHMKDPARRDQVARFVAEHDMQLTVGYHPGIFKNDDDTIKRYNDQFLADLQTYGDTLRVPIVTTGAGGVHRFMAKPSLPEMIDRMAKMYAPVAKACHEMGRPLGIENHGDFYCSDLVELCARTPHMHIFLDTGNTYLIGEKSVPACREAAPYTIGTHFKDHCVHPDPGTLMFVIEGAPLGEGHVGLREIYDILLKHAPNPDKLVMHWEMVPPKDMSAYECLERSWKFIRSLPEPGKK